MTDFIGMITRMSNYYLHRLADPDLLRQAIVTECGDLAVPVGGTRLGGWTQVLSVEEGEYLIQKMQQEPKLFPNPRFAYGRQVVKFGPDAPENDDADNRTSDYRHDVNRGRFYGYSEQAIQEFTQRTTVKETQRNGTEPWEPSSA